MCKLLIIDDINYIITDKFVYKKIKNYILIIENFSYFTTKFGENFLHYL